MHSDFFCVIGEKEPRNCVTESFGRWPTIYSSLGLRSNQGDNHGYYRFRYHEGNSGSKGSIPKGRQDQFSGKPWSRRVGGTSGCTGDGRIYQDQDWSRYGRRQPSQRYIRSRVDQPRQPGIIRAKMVDFILIYKFFICKSACKRKSLCKGAFSIFTYLHGLLFAHSRKK